MPNHLDVADIDNRAEALAKDKHNVFLMDGIGQDNEAARQTEIPENFRHDALLGALAINPLENKAHHEKRLAEEADKNPQCEFRLKPNKEMGELFLHDRSMSVGGCGTKTKGYRRFEPNLYTRSAVCRHVFFDRLKLIELQGIDRCFARATAQTMKACFIQM